VDERQPPEVDRPRRSPAAIVVVSVLAVLALAAALYVIVKSLRRVTPESVPVALQNPPPDTGFVFFRASLRRKVRTLEMRCRTKRKQLEGGLSPRQDSLSRECDSAVAMVLAHIAAFDSVTRSDRKAASDSLKAEYERAKARVNAFTRSGLGGDGVSNDSLDRELKKLISE
jgi:hypothetical protein